jgi:hypothetical protein
MIPSMDKEVDMTYKKPAFSKEPLKISAFAEAAAPYVAFVVFVVFVMA